MQWEATGSPDYFRFPEFTNPLVRKLRISVTDRCNLRCQYCMPASGVSPLRHSDLLSMEELSSVAAWLCRNLEIEQIKLTGGEPLARSGLKDLIAELACVSCIREVSMTTNGTLLRGMANDLRRAGLRRVNISLDTLNAARFEELTRGGSLSAVLEGISAALHSGLERVKLNAVLRRSSWREDVPALLQFAASHNLEIRFIELMRTGTELSWCEKEYIPAAEIQFWLIKQGYDITKEENQGGPANLFTIQRQGVIVRVGWITPRSHPFCSRCDRLRLDARGRVFRCLMDEQFLPLAEILRAKGNEAASDAITEYLSGKSAPFRMSRANAMSLIGG
jgi:GTP 3',8-cyclase